MLSLQTVDPHTLELLRAMMAEPLFADLRLVDGTALALQYGHRKSVDLDLFGKMPADEDEMKNALDTIGVVQVLKEAERIRVYMIDDVKVDFVDYTRYPWIDAPIIEDGIRLASPRDIAAMKINAIEGRGSMKDFIDIYFLLHHFSFEKILGCYSQKYPEHSIFRALMSLTYFEDAESQFMPMMFEPVRWPEVREYISKVVKDYSDRISSTS